MTNYLVTWYGLTDLRAALGVEDTSGPVLSALATGDYSDALIVAYTNPDKQQSFSGEIREEWEDWVTTPVDDRTPLTRDRLDRFSDAVSNTSDGHKLFGEWLERELSQRGIDVTVNMSPHSLKHLNDAAGIYDAATAAVRVAASDPSHPVITTYLSPGTPVMAYTWALIARASPHLDIAVLASSDPRRAPESIDLPNTLLDNSIRYSDDPGPREYDLVIHMLGEQAMPVVFGLRQFTAQRHVILTTSEYQDQARRLAKSAGMAPQPIVVASPFRPADTRRAITKQVSKLPAAASVAVNVTGGTKLMFAGALSACWEQGLDPVYFEIKNHDVVFLRDGSHVPFVGVSDIEDFVHGSGFTTLEDGHWPADPTHYRNDRLASAEAIWRHRSALRGLYSLNSFRDALKYLGRGPAREQQDSRACTYTWKDGEASTDAGMDGDTRLVLHGQVIDVARPGFVSFIGGGWLEDYVYSLLRPLKDEGVVKDLRVGYMAGYDQTTPNGEPPPAQEFDLAFTDGKRLWIVECTAGLVVQDHVQKLENNLRQFGGVAAKGILISGRPSSTAMKNRIATVPNVTAVEPGDLSTDTLRTIIVRG